MASLREFFVLKLKGPDMKRIFIILALALFISPVVAQQKTPPPPGPERPLSLPKITEKKLSNGLTVVLAPLPNVPKVTLGDDWNGSRQPPRHRANSLNCSQRRHRLAHQQAD
jgi:hypothetical protein